MQQYKHAVVIVTYNRIKLLKECIAAVCNQTSPFQEIIIVNNNSNDGTDVYLDTISKNDSRFKIYNMDENLGGAGGFCFGLRKVSREIDYVLIIDDDAILSNDFINEIENNMKPEILAYSGVVKTEGQIDGSHRRIITNKTLLFRRDVAFEKYEEPFFDYDFATFCGLVVNNSLIKKIGLPKQEYFIWNDDSEYSLRIRRLSKIRNINSAELNHKTKKVDAEKLSWKSYYGYRNFWDMGVKYSSHPLVFKIFRICFHIERIIIYSLKIGNYERNSKIVKLHINVLKDIKAKKFGVREEYLYGKW